jgi:hypothetical protein
MHKLVNHRNPERSFRAQLQPQCDDFLVAGRSETLSLVSTLIPLVQRSAVYARIRVGGGNAVVGEWDSEAMVSRHHVCA